MWEYIPVRQFIFAWCLDRHRDSGFLFQLKVWIVPSLFVALCFRSAKTQVQTDGRPYEISGGECGTGVGFASSIFGFLQPVTIPPTLRTHLPSVGEGGGWCNTPKNHVTHSRSHPAFSMTDKTEGRTISPLASTFQTDSVETSCVIGVNWMWRRCCVVASRNGSSRTLYSSWFSASLVTWLP
jgi:hypothetical protein